MHKSLYKKTIDEENLQEERRQSILKQQKQRRQQILDEGRTIHDEIKTVTSNTKGRRTFKAAYGSNLTLQLSEWLKQRPEDLSDWILVPCPKGQRCMVVACSGRTEMYNKAGRWQFTFKSALPGDISYNPKRRSVTILDCIYVKDLDKFYILDALSYGEQDLVFCEAQFRFFWLNSKLEEMPRLCDRNDSNEKPFILLDHHKLECRDLICSDLQRFPYWPNFEPNLDGFLFYHKEASYTCGSTPLVCWLFPFMVPDMLELAVSSYYEYPIDYSGPNSYMEMFDLKFKEKLNRRNKSIRQMEVDEGNEECSIQESDMNESSESTINETSQSITSVDVNGC